MQTTRQETVHDVANSRNSRYGLLLFGIYVALYGGFIGLAVYNAPLLGRPVVAGVNLAILYGLFLIVAALVLALVYMALCKDPAEDPHHTNSGH